MRKKLVEAAMVVLAESNKGMSAVIDDVIKEAGVARGTFYNYFQSMDEVKSAIGETLNEQMVDEFNPIYQPIKCPTDRFAVGTRMFLIRACLDRSWASFVKLPEVWSQKVLVAVLMSKDLSDAKAQGLMHFDNLRVATDYMLGGVASAIQALGSDIPDPLDYISQSCLFALRALQCNEQQIASSMEFSEAYLSEWVGNAPRESLPRWVQDSSADQVKKFFSL